MEKLQILDCRTRLRGKSQHNLFIQFAEVVRKAMRQYLVGERKVAEELVLISNRNAEKRRHGGTIFG